MVIAHILVVSILSSSIGALHPPDFGRFYNDESIFDFPHRRFARSSEMSSNFRSEKYTTTFKVIPESHRKPDNILFQALVHDNERGIEHDISVNGKDELRAFKWSPSNVAFSFVLDDNVYYAASPEQIPVKVTHNEKDGLLHGTFDWVYNEEIFGRGNIAQGAMWISPSDKYLAYASRRVNSSEKILMTTYSREDRYDYNYEMEYPKTGEKRLAEMSVSIWSVEQNKSITIDVQLRDRESFHYLFGVSWVTLYGKELLLTTWANRWQNETSVTLCDYETGACSLIYEHKYEHAQWASPDDYANIVHSNSSFFILLPRPLEDNAWQHIAKLSITPDFRLDSIEFVPSGAYDIVTILAYRPAEDLIFYTAQAPHPWNLLVYASPAGERSILKSDQCVTCGYSSCTFQERVDVSQGEDLKIELWCNGPGRGGRLRFSPILSTQPDGTVHYQLANLPKDDDFRPDFKIETFVLPSGYEALVQIFEGDLNLTSIPVTLFVYGAPGFNQVADKPTRFPHSSYKHALVHIDVRGSSGRGWNYRSQIYGRLITVEVQDTYEAMRMVLEKYPRLDKNRVGVHGWSHGGTITTGLVEVAPNGFFKCACVGAPVTNFALYDATYSERFMADTPLASYTDLTLDVSKFAHTKLLLVHGLRDDNVHFQHSALLIEALQQADIPFELMVYPNEAHGVKRVSSHWDHMFDSFFSECYA